MHGHPSRRLARDAAHRSQPQGGEGQASLANPPRERIDRQTNEGRTPPLAAGASPPGFGLGVEITCRVYRRGDRASRHSSGWSSSTSRSCCESGPPASSGSMGPCDRWSNGCCASFSSAAFSSTASRGGGAQTAAVACPSPFPAVAAASPPPARRRSNSTGPGGCGRSCSLRLRTVTWC